MKTTKFQNRIKLGQVDSESIYLYAPSWDCGWYWGFGYLGNSNCHYHVSGLEKDVNLFDGLVKHFGDSFIVKNEKDIWTLAELFKTFYVLKETAEVLGRGGSHMSTNPLANVIKNPDEVKRINEVLMPQIFDCIYELLTKKQKAVHEKVKQATN